MDIEEIIIRTFSPPDLSAILAITAEVFGPVSIDLNMERLFGPFGKGDWESRKLAAIEMDCNLQPASVFVATMGNRIAGYITTRLNSDTGIGWIPNLAVGAEYQKRGIGQKLLVHAIEYLRQGGMDVAKIETLEQNPVGQRLYPALGFEIVATQIHYALKLTPPYGKPNE